MLTNLDSVIDRWNGPDGPTLRPPTTARISFLQQDATALDCWSLWNRTDGFGLPKEQDGNGFCFWPLSSMLLAIDVDGGCHVSGDAPDMVVFADYMTWSWAYAVVVDSRSAHFGAVFLVGTSDGIPQFVADSFDRFLKLYLMDSPLLYPR
jgi:hypothetical protein